MSDANSKKSSTGALVLHHAITAALVLGVLSLGVWSYLTFSKESFFYESQDKSSSLQLYLADSQQAKLQLAVDTYREMHGSIPISLDALVGQGLVDASDLSYPSGSVEYSLEVVGDDVFVKHNARKDAVGASKTEAKEPSPGDEGKEKVKGDE